MKKLFLALCAVLPAGALSAGDILFNSSFELGTEGFAIRRFLTEDIGATDTLIYIDDPTYLEEIACWEGHSRELNMVKIGKELVHYLGVTKEKPYRLLKVTRGYWNTVPTAHAKGDAVDKVQPTVGGAYAGLVPNLELQDELARHYADICKNCGLGMFDYDGQEFFFHTGFGSYSVKRFFRNMFAQAREYGLPDIRFTGATLSEGSWHYQSTWNVGGGLNIYDVKKRVWGSTTSQGKDLRDVTYANFFPSSFGANFPITAQSTVEDFEHIEATAVGYGCTYALKIGQRDVESCPQKYGIFQVIRTWEEARRANAFPTYIRKLLQNPDLSWRLERNEDAEGWILYQITDPAIVAAATLSNRYITDRQLPDKAIDLIDEAAASIRLQIDSKPEPLDRLDRKIIQLKMERQAVAKETDDASKKRLQAIDEEIDESQKEYSRLDEIWKKEKLSLEGTQQIKVKLDAARHEFDVAKRQGDLSRMSELQYGIIPSLEKQIKEAGDAPAEKSFQLLKNKVTDVEIAEVVSKATGIPVAKMLEGERAKLLHMEENLHQRVIGQDEAINAIANAIRRSRAGLSDPNRPIGSFMFMGPTGVGKTELCKAVAEFLFDTEKAMVRIDMSEFMEKFSVSRLVGAPPGYVGYEQGGYLTEAVRRRPYSVILLDEIEKAHPDVFNILLQVLDDGRLTDGQGRTVDFKNTVIIMTSNLGSEMIQEETGKKSYQEIKAQLLNILEKHFKPEFLNRVDETVVFHPLTHEQIKKIAKIQLDGLMKRLSSQGYEVILPDSLIDHVANIGFDPVFGARPLRRAIQNTIEDPLANMILGGKVQVGEPFELNFDANGELISTKPQANC